MSTENVPCAIVYADAYIRLGGIRWGIKDAEAEEALMGKEPAPSAWEEISENGFGIVIFPKDGGNPLFCHGVVPMDIIALYAPSGQFIFFL